MMPCIPSQTLEPELRWLQLQEWILHVQRLFGL